MNRYSKLLLGTTAVFLACANAAFSSNYLKDESSLENASRDELKNSHVALLAEFQNQQTQLQQAKADLDVADTKSANEANVFADLSDDDTFTKKMLMDLKDQISQNAALDQTHDDTKNKNEATSLDFKTKVNEFNVKAQAQAPASKAPDVAILSEQDKLDLEMAALKNYFKSSTINEIELVNNSEYPYTLKQAQAAAAAEGHSQQIITDVNVLPLGHEGITSIKIKEDGSFVIRKSAYMGRIFDDMYTISKK